MKSYTYVVISDAESDRNNQGEQIFSSGANDQTVERITITNTEGSNATVNLYKVPFNGTAISIIPKNSIIPAYSTMLIGGSLVVAARQYLLASTNKTIHVDINIA